MIVKKNQRKISLYLASVGLMLETVEDVPSTLSITLWQFLLCTLPASARPLTDGSFGFSE
jgi:hypothetical protein